MGLGVGLKVFNFDFSLLLKIPPFLIAMLILKSYNSRILILSKPLLLKILIFWVCNCPPNYHVILCVLVHAGSCAYFLHNHLLFTFLQFKFRVHRSDKCVSCTCLNLLCKENGVFPLLPSWIKKNFCSLTIQKFIISDFWVGLGILMSRMWYWFK